jgi:hypothetical protein
MEFYARRGLQLGVPETVPGLLRASVAVIQSTSPSGSRLRQRELRRAASLCATHALAVGASGVAISAKVTVPA